MLNYKNKAETLLLALVDYKSRFATYHIQKPRIDKLLNNKQK